MKTGYRIPLSIPSITQREIVEITHATASTWVSSQSPWVNKFETLFAKKIAHTKYAVSLNSGTSALFLALKALGIGPGHEVITPTFTMIATINAIVWTGARPVLVDCASKDDWNMDVAHLEKLITPKTKAIMPVHIYGHMSNMKEINRIAKQYSLAVIEDAAEAMGSEYFGKRAGALSTISCFSLYANKIVTAGNGGMLCTNDKKMYELVKKLAFFDFNEKTHFKHLLFGYNLVLSGIQSALGYAQAKRFEMLLAYRRKVQRWYRKHIKSERVYVVVPGEGQNPNYWFPALLFTTPGLKKKTVQALESKKIETRDFFIPAHQQPIYKGVFPPAAFPNADYFLNHGLLVPSFYDMSEKQVIEIATIINKITK